jgi:hypothetical protein
LAASDIEALLVPLSSRELVQGGIVRFRHINVHPPSLIHPSA